MRAEEKQTLTCTAENWGLRDAALAMWSYYTAPQRESEHRAFFYVFSLALQQPDSYREFLASLDNWSVLTAELGMAQGLEPELARQSAQLIVSSIRGLLMDRLTSADPGRVDATFDLLLDALLPQQPSAGSNSRRPAKAARGKSPRLQRST
jgi:hypothetical protein